MTVGVKAGWAAQAERGSPVVVRAALAVLLWAGPWVLPLLVWPSTAWFLATSGRARGASREYLGRVLGRRASTWDVARHFHAFSRAVGDRVLLVAGWEERFEIEMVGLEALLDVLAEGRGCILMGAHLGSFEVLRTVAQRCPVPVWALMHRRPGGSLGPLLEELAPDLAARVLVIGDTASMIQARECVERGEIVGILADRMPEGPPAGHRMVGVPFLGSEAAFPSGPFVLAATLGAPVVLFHGVRVAGGWRRRGRYRVEFQQFAERVVLRRASRAADLAAVVGRYAAALEGTCRAYPFQWFNFFPFWERRGDGKGVAAVRPGAGGVLVGKRAG